MGRGNGGNRARESGIGSTIGPEPHAKAIFGARSSPFPIPVPSSSYTKIYAVVRRIPAGKVATYGQVAELAGLPNHARLVGYALHAISEGTTIPWHRVINAQGKISIRGSASASITQRLRLEQEGVRFTGGRVKLDVYGWKARRRS